MVARGASLDGAAPLTEQVKGGRYSLRCLSGEAAGRSGIPFCQGNEEIVQPGDKRGRLVDPCAEGKDGLAI